MTAFLTDFRTTAKHRKAGGGRMAHLALRWLLALLIPLALAACDGAEEREKAYFDRGKALYEAGDYRKAALELKNARQINPLNMEALYYLGLISEKQGDYRGAFGAFQSVLEQKDAHVGANLHIGRIYLMSGDIDQALTKAQKALAVEPQNIDGHAFARCGLSAQEPARRCAQGSAVRAREAAERRRCDLRSRRRPAEGR